MTVPRLRATLISAALIATALVPVKPTGALEPRGGAVFPEEIHGCDASLRIEVPHPAATATFETDAGDSVAFVASARATATELIAPERPLPIEGYLTLSAPGRATERFHLAFARATKRVIDLGVHPLAPGIAGRLRVVDAAGDAVANAAIHALDRETRFPPHDPADRSGSRSFLDAVNRIARTDSTGLTKISLPLDARNLAVLTPGRGPVFASLGTDDVPATLVLGEGVPFTLALRPSEPGLLHSTDITAYVDLGGVAFEARFAVDAPTSLSLDAARAVRIVVEARGFKTATRLVEPKEMGAGATPITLDLEALSLAFATIEARDAATKQVLDLTELRLGRARAHPREFPDRVDFAPDWNSFRIGTTEPPLCAAPRGRVDLFAAALDHRETVIRGLEFTGTREAPAALVVELPGVLPVHGVVRDATTRVAIPDACVTLRRVSRDLDDLPLAWKIRGTVGYVCTASTGANGTFREKSESYESLVAEVEADGYATATFGPFPRETAHNIAMDLDRGHTLAGRVEGAKDGDMVALLATAGNRLELVAIERDGTFRCNTLAAGRYSVIALPDPRAAIARGRGEECSRVERALETAELQVELTADRLDVVITRGS